MSISTTFTEEEARAEPGNRTGVVCLAAKLQARVYDILPSTKSGRVWRKVPESDARSVRTSLTPYRLAQAAREAKVVGRQ